MYRESSTCRDSFRTDEEQMKMLSCFYKRLMNRTYLIPSHKTENTGITNSMDLPLYAKFIHFLDPRQKDQAISKKD